MRAVVRDLLRARTQAGGRHHDFEPHVGLAVAVFAEDGGLIVHQALDAGHRRLLHDEVGKGHLDVAGGRIQMLGHLFQHLAERIDRNFALVAMQDLDEAGHVRALEVVRQVHVHVEIRDRVLLAAGAVLHFDRMIDILDADLVDRDLARIGMALHILDGLTLGFLAGAATFIFGFPADAIRPEMVPKPRNSRILDDSSRLGSRASGAATDRRSSAATRHQAL